MTDLHGKLAIVTGSNTGIGRVTAEDLARRGVHVFLANRSEDKTRPVVEAIRAAGGTADFLKLDLGDLASVRSAAETFLRDHDRLDLLINNAGLAGQRGLTKDGFELAFGTNHLGHYLLTRLLMPALERPAHARVVNVSSKSHYQAKGIDWGAVRQPTSPTGLGEYAVSKLANVLFTKELARRAKPSVHAYSLHPGVVATDVWRRVPWGLRHLIKLFMISEEEGARTTLYCAASPEVEGDSGKYYDKCRERRPSRAADDASLARALWDKSAEWVGLAP